LGRDADPVDGLSSRLVEPFVLRHVEIISEAGVSLCHEVRMKVASDLVLIEFHAIYPLFPDHLPRVTEIFGVGKRHVGPDADLELFGGDGRRIRAVPILIGTPPVNTGYWERSITKPIVSHNLLYTEPGPLIPAPVTLRTR